MTLNNVKETIMSVQTEVAEAYFRAFEDDDHERILSLLTEDVVWEVYGRRSLRGRDAFATEIVGEGFESGPDLHVERFLESGDVVVVPHSGETHMEDGTPFRFVACDILTFRDGLISKVESYVVPLQDVSS